MEMKVSDATKEMPGVKILHSKGMIEAAYAVIPAAMVGGMLSSGYPYALETITLAIVALVFWLPRRSVVESKPTRGLERKKNLVINYHFHRRCNYSCKFCFHTSKNGDLASLPDAKRAMAILKDQGMIRVNFSGGEPFLQPSWLGSMCQFCHEHLGISVSIVSNGSKINAHWMKKFGRYVDVLAISCDSFNEETLRKIGRYEKRTNHIAQLHKVRDWCMEHKITFKINSVICSANKHETMVDEITELQPARWKVFQCLLIDGENAGPDALRDAQDQVISKEEFDTFVKRHEVVDALVPEDNDTMRNS